MGATINEAVKRCSICQHRKKIPIPKRVPRHFPQTDRFKTVHVDIVGPLVQTAKGKLYLFTMIDRFSRWIEAVPMRTITTEECSRAFIDTWVSRFGVPDVIISDRGTQ